MLSWYPCSHNVADLALGRSRFARRRWIAAGYAFPRRNAPTWDAATPFGPPCAKGRAEEISNHAPPADDVADVVPMNTNGQVPKVHGPDHTPATAGGLHDLGSAILTAEPRIEERTKSRFPQLRHEFANLRRNVGLTVLVSFALCFVDVLLALSALSVGMLHSCARLFGLSTGLGYLAYLVRSAATAVASSIRLRFMRWLKRISN